MKRRLLLSLASLSLLLGSCTLYQPSPVNLSRDTQAWQNLSAQVAPAGRSLSRAQMQRVGLMLNPELNAARLTYAKSTAAAKYAGLWEDPVLSGNLERVLKENLFNGGLSMSLALPVTGLPKLAKQIAGHYKQADYWDMREKERAYLAELDGLRAQLLVMDAKLVLMDARLKNLSQEKAQITRLQEMGEVDFAQAMVLKQRHSDMIKEQQELSSDRLAKQLELVQLLGLYPRAGSSVRLAESLPSGIPSLVAAPSVEQLMANPALRAKQAQYGAGEVELRAELRKQYPTLNLGPAFSREERESKLGLGFEMGLPAWNRNRGGIAEARVGRELRKQQYLAEWRRLLTQSDSLVQRQKLAYQHCRNEQERIEQLRGNTDTQERLFGMGESSLAELAEARHEMYQRRLSYYDCLSELLSIQAELSHLNQ